MSATLRQRDRSNAAAHDLWRVAETGEIDELSRILRTADVNARNKHGMTALMRAAYHGHEQMVRALLEHGADPNRVRNDKFTALALAAFFGHTEIVRILIEHGAKTEIITRCGASAKTWATARTFDEAARCIDSHAPASAPARVPRAPAPAIKTLKDPPEIWDLVQEVPRDFNAGSAFVSRLKSMNPLRIAAVVVVSAACVVGVLVLRGSQARSVPAEQASIQSAAENKVSTPVSAENPASETTVSSSAAEVAEFSHHSESYDVNSTTSRKQRLLLRQPRTRSTPVEEPIEIVQSRELPAPATAPTVATPRVEPRNTSKPSTSLSPQLIAPAKSAPPKAKVIQWP